MLTQRRALLLAVLMLLSCRPAPPPPNLLILVMDTTRADRCSVFGYHRPTTPRLAAMAKEGMAFANAWSPAGWTGPAHASLFTGLRLENHGYYDGNPPFLADEADTLAETFGQNGYATACFTNNGFITEHYGLTQGFQHYDPLFEQANTKPYQRKTHEKALAWAVETRKTGKPFFLFINDIEPHVPYEPPLFYAEQYVPAGSDPAKVRVARELDWQELQGYMVGRVDFDATTLGLISDLYDAEIAGLDNYIGKLLDDLAKEGLLDDTIVVIMGDHGENLGEHHLLDHKFSLHKTIRHVPLLMRYPRRVPAGVVVNDVVRVEDVTPTVLALTGVAPPGPMDGESLLGDTKGRIARALYGRMPRYGEIVAELYPGIDQEIFNTSIAAIFDGRYHYMLYSNGREELYNIQNDPQELRNLAASEPARCAELRSQLRVAPPG